METINRPDLDLVLLQDLEFEIQCESVQPHHQHAHTADWVAIHKCGHSMNLCEFRRQETFGAPGGSTVCHLCKRAGKNWQVIVSWLPIEK